MDLRFGREWHVLVICWRLSRQRLAEPTRTSGHNIELPSQFHLSSVTLILSLRLTTTAWIPFSSVYPNHYGARQTCSLCCRCSPDINYRRWCSAVYWIHVCQVLILYHPFLTTWSIDQTRKRSLNLTYVPLWKPSWAWERRCSTRCRQLLWAVRISRETQRGREHGAWGSSNLIDLFMIQKTGLLHRTEWMCYVESVCYYNGNAEQFIYRRDWHGQLDIEVYLYQWNEATVWWVPS